MKLLVLTFSTNNTNPGLIHLTNSLKKFRYDYEVLSGPEFSWSGNNLKPIANWLRKNKGNYTHFLYTDAWDTLALAPADELLKKYNPNKWLYSAEKNCYPRSDWAEKFTAKTRWRYLNAGGYITPIDLFLEMEKRALRHGEDDQEFGSWTYLFDNPGKIQLDSGCRIFQTLYMEDADEFGWTRDGRLYNRITNTYPVFVHGNGKVDMRWIYHPQPSKFYT